MGFLRDIAAEIRADIARPQYLDGTERPVEVPHRPSLREKILSAGAAGALVVEFKRRSPGASDPKLPSRTAEEFVRATESAGVAGYSCLATGPRFEGSPRDVAQLARATEAPVLFKDFVLGTEQLDAAVRAGASAVLLIARLEAEGLLDRPLAELADQAHARGLEVLLEMHARSELRRTAGVAADVYGVNSRDLDTLRIERRTAAATIRAAKDLRPLLGLSGVEAPADAEWFWALGTDGILVGTAVARARDPASFLRSLRRGVRGEA